MTLSREELERLRLSIDEIEDSQGVLWGASDLAAQCLTQMDEIETLRKQTAEMKEALEPSEATKAAYIGEFSFTIPRGDYISERTIDVPWTTIKEIMAAIRARAARGKE